MHTRSSGIRGSYNSAGGSARASCRSVYNFDAGGNTGTRERGDASELRCASRDIIEVSVGLGGMGITPVWAGICNCFFELSLL